jgi:tetratricopeptide (TPR) repeat protein
MRKLLLLTLAITSFQLVAQQKAPVLDTVELAKKIFIYNASRQYNDPTVSRMALYSLLSENPNNIALRDSLALIYFEQQQYASAALVAQEVVSAVPSDMFAAEIAAISFERLGVKNKALSFYQKLFLDNSDDLNTLYKMAFLQYDLKLFEESANTADQLISHALTKETNLIFPTTDGKGQEVSMEMSALRLKAMIEAAKGNKDKAKELFNQVLKVVPDFELVKQQIAELEKQG